MFYLSFTAVPSPDGSWRVYCLRRSTRAVQGHGRVAGQLWELHLRSLQGASVEAVAGVLRLVLEETDASYGERLRQNASGEGAEWFDAPLPTL